MTNTDTFARTGIEVQLLYPADVLDNLPETLISDGGDCQGGGVGNTCDVTDEPLVWNLGALPAGTGITVSLTPRVAAGLAAGTIIPFAPEAQDSSGMLVTDSRSVPVVTNRHLELVVGEDRDPVVPGEVLTYTLTYGHSATSSAATGSLLSLPLPAGSTLVAATGGGTLVGGEVQWSLGTLAPGQVGQQQATVQVGAGQSLGTLLGVQARLSDSSGGCGSGPGTAGRAAPGRVDGEQQRCL